MPQMQLPIFPAGVTEINPGIAVRKEAGTVYYIHGRLPVFEHGERDVGGFRMFTSQMIVNGTVKPKEIVQAFGVPMITVKRYVKLFREQGAKGFYETKPRHSSASALKGEVLERAQGLLDAGRSVPEVAGELKVLANTLHKAIRAGRLRRGPKKANPPQPQQPTRASAARSTARRQWGTQRRVRWNGWRRRWGRWGRRRSGFKPPGM